MAKCYVYRCVACGGLDLADRADKLTCSTACRVKAHRSGETARIKGIAALPAVRCEPGMIARACALAALWPEAEEQVRSGHRTIDSDDTQAEMRRRFWAMSRLVRASSA